MKSQEHEVLCIPIISYVREYFSKDKIYACIFNMQIMKRVLNGGLRRERMTYMKVVKE